MKVATRYGKCLKPFPRQVLNIIVHGGKKSLKEYCDATKGRAGKLKDNRYLHCNIHPMAILTLLNKQLLDR